jgi:hypothetical protein
VLEAIMHPDPVPSACIRFGVSRFTTAEEIDYAIERFAAVVGHLRKDSKGGTSSQSSKDSEIGSLGSGAGSRKPS